MSAAEDVNAGQDFGTLDQWLEIVQDAANKLGFLDQLQDIVRHVTNNLILYQNLNNVNFEHVIKDFDIPRFLDAQCKFLITLIRHKSELKEGIIDDDIIKLAIDIAYKACLAAGFETGITIQGQKDLHKFKEIEMYLNIIRDAFCNLDKYISKSYKDNELREAIQNSVEKVNLKNILDSEDIKYYDFYRKLPIFSLESFSNQEVSSSFYRKITRTVFLATRIMFAAGFIAGQKYALSQRWSQEATNML